MLLAGHNPYYIAYVGYDIARYINFVISTLECDLGIEVEITGKTGWYINDPSLFKSIPEIIEKIEKDDGTETEYLKRELNSILRCFQLVHELYVLAKIIMELIYKGARILDKRIGITPNYMPSNRFMEYGNRISFEYLNSKITILYQPIIGPELRRPDFVIVNDYIKTYSDFVNKCIGQQSIPPVKDRAIVLDPKVSFSKGDFHRLLKYVKLFPKGTKFLVLALDEETIPTKYKQKLNNIGWIIIENVKPDGANFEYRIINSVNEVFELT